MKKILTLALSIALVARPAQAQLLFAETFNSENGGSSVLNYNSFANWNVTGRVDLVRSGDFGITCFGMCVDIDGSAGPGAITTKNTFAFNTGDVMTIAFDVSGSQRGSGLDDLYLDLVFGQSIPFVDYSGTGGFAFATDVNGLFTPTYRISQSNVAGTDPFANWSFSFTAASAGSLAYTLGTTSRDNIGPVLDNISITNRSSTVPEPSTWALLAAGLAVVGSVARRRTNA